MMTPTTTQDKCICCDRVKAQAALKWEVNGVHPVTGVITEIGVVSWTKKCQKCVGKQADVPPGQAVCNAAAPPPALCTAAGAAATAAATAEAIHVEIPSDRTLALSGGDKLPACAVATVVAAAERAAAAVERAATARSAAAVGGLGSNSANYGVGKPGTMRCSVEDELRRAELLPALEAFTAGFENVSKPRLSTLESITGNLHMLTLLAHPRPKAQGSASPEEVRTCLRCCCVSGAAAMGLSREPATHRLWLWLIHLAMVTNAQSLTRRLRRRGHPARPTHSSVRRRRRRQRY